MTDYDVIVAGVGGMGSAAVAELAGRGARVLGLERASIPHDTGSSHGINRIIRLAYAEDPRYVPLLRLAYRRWHELGERLGETILIKTGGIDMGRADAASVVGALASAREHDLEHELLDAREIHARFPGFEPPDDIVGVYSPDGGFVLSERAIAGHASLALEAGAEIHGHEPVLDWEPRDGGVIVRTAVAEYRARRLIVSAGAWVGKLVQGLAPVAVPERRVLLWARTRRPELFTPEALPIFIIDTDEGQFYGFPEYGIPGLKFGEMRLPTRVVDPDDWDRSRFEPEDEALLRKGLARYLPQANGAALSLKTCMFTRTPDEHFIIDTLPDAPQVVVVSPCSGHGFKFSVVIGEIAADLALDGATGHDIEMFRMDRFEEVSA